MTYDGHSHVVPLKWPPVYDEALQTSQYEKHYAFKFDEKTSPLFETLLVIEPYHKETGLYSWHHLKPRDGVLLNVYSWSCEKSDG